MKSAEKRKLRAKGFEGPHQESCLQEVLPSGSPSVPTMTQRKSRLPRKIVSMIWRSLRRLIAWLKDDWERSAEIHNRMKSAHDERNKNTNYFFIR